MAEHTILHLAPSQLMRVFHVNSIEIDGGASRDIVDVACKLYLLWKSEYPDYKPTLTNDGNPRDAAILQKALFS